MSSKTSLANRALIKIGCNLISSIDQTENKNAETMKILYDVSREQLLRSHLWNFAVKRQTLAALTTSPAFDFNYEFQLPSDCLRVVRLKYPDQLYKIEGRKLLCDDSSVGLIYISNITDVNQFDAGFEECLVLKLAADSCLMLTGNSNLAAALKSELEIMLRKAKQYDSQEDLYSQISFSLWSREGDD